MRSMEMNEADNDHRWAPAGLGPANIPGSSRVKVAKQKVLGLKTNFNSKLMFGKPKIFSLRPILSLNRCSVNQRYVRKTKDP